MARTNKSRAPALAYLRTSSAVNVGTDKDRMRLQLFDKGSAHAWRRLRSTVIGHLLRFEDLGLKMKKPTALRSASVMWKQFVTLSRFRSWWKEEFGQI